ncbi:MAG TPA: alpha/beta hydrolase [Spongiibacteraceae bacterium]|nr:alpha/beta hydrolase [Spongiibacteraceae bacterium]
MTYKIDNHGNVDLGSHTIPVPKTISLEAQALLATPPLAQLRPAGDPAPAWAARAEVDAQMLQLNEFARSLFPVEIEEVRIAGVRCHWVRPLEVATEHADKLLINLHAGSFVLGSGALAEAIPIANLAKISVLAIDYRLAPEHPFPAAVDDVVAVYRAMLERFSPTKIAVFGTSAGGFLAGQAAMRLQKEGLPVPACLGMFTAGGDLSDFGDTAQIYTLMGFYGELLLPVDHELSEVRAYRGDTAANDPLFSPLYGDLAHFPPTLMVSGTRDVILSSASTFHRALRRAGVDADLFVFDAMQHGFWYALHLPEAREAIDIMVKFFLKHLRGRSD